MAKTETKRCPTGICKASLSGADEQMWTQLFAGGGVTVNRVGADPVKINHIDIDERIAQSWNKITHGYYEKRYR